MVLGSGIVRKATRIGGKNKFALIGVGLGAYLLLSKRGQTTALSGIPIVSGAGSAIASTIENIIPLDIFGRELSSIGSGFGEFGVGINTGISNIFAPLRNFIDWANNLVGLNKAGDPASAEVAEEIG
jgi:hypothetical protein